MNQEIIARYIGQPASLPAELRSMIERAWDGEPEKHIISYKTALGTALMGKRPGEAVKVKLGGNEEEFTVVSISRVTEKVET